MRSTGGEAGVVPTHWWSMMSDLERRTGVVVDFDEHVGLGHVDGDGETFLFHCVEILDGSRKIAVGASVSFVAVSRFGLREASALEPLA